MTNKTKQSHTPGPWVLYGLDVKDNSRIRISLSPGATPNAAYLTEIKGINQKRKANAHLIAAAPELLEAAKACLLALGNEDYVGWSIRSQQTFVNEALLLVEKAIAKATYKAEGKRR